MTLPVNQQEGTNVIYNDIAIRNCTIREFDQQVVLDDSQTDKLYDTFRISVIGQIHQDETYYVTTDAEEDDTGTPTGNNNINATLGVDAPIGNETTGGSPVRDVPTMLEIKTYLQKRLLEPRQEFRLYIGDQFILNATQSNNKTEVFNAPEIHDVRNGPHPQRATIVEVIGEAFMTVEFSIEFSLASNDPNGLPADFSLVDKNNFTWAKDAEEEFGVLNNRWQMVESRNAEMMLTRTIAGKMVVRHPTWLPHLFVHLVIPPQPRNMQVVAQEFTTSPNGLEFTYRIVHQQRYAAPPYPAIDWSGTHTESTEAPGAFSNGSINLTLTGGPNTQKKSLFYAAMQMAIQKLTYDSLASGIGSSGPQNPSINSGGASIANNGLILYRSIVYTDVLEKNQVNIAMSVRRSNYREIGDGTRFGGVPIAKLGVLPSIAAFAPAFDTNKTYYQGSIISSGSDRYRAKKTIASGSSFDSSEWEDITAQVVDRDDANGAYRDQWPNMSPYDPNTALGQFANYWQNPALKRHGIPTAKDNSSGAGSVAESFPSGYEQSAELENNNTLTNAPANAVYATVDNYDPTVPGDTLVSVSNDHGVNSIYTELEMESRYVVDTGNRGFPRSIVNDPAATSSEDDQTDRLASSPTKGDIVTQTDVGRKFEFLGGQQVRRRIGGTRKRVKQSFKCFRQLQNEVSFSKQSDSQRSEICRV